jgi:hypothetical protein
MSDQYTRKSDGRIDSMEDTLKEVVKVQKEVVNKVEAIRVRIFNGYDQTIKNTNEKVNYIDAQNTRDHDRIEKAVEKLGAELRADVKKILLTFLGATFLILVAWAVKEIII